MSLVSQSDSHIWFQGTKMDGDSENTELEASQWGTNRWLMSQWLHPYFKHSLLTI